MTLSKIKIQTLKDMNGEEMKYQDRIIMIDYPYIIEYGKRKKTGESTWRKIYDAFWNDSRNEGYWIKQEARREFGI